MDHLAANQEATGQEIQKIVSNFRKDPQNRKTLPYFEERLSRLTSLWETFDATDSEIRQLPAVSQHDYFTAAYYDAIADVYNRQREDFLLQIQLLSTKASIQDSATPCQEKAATQGDKPLKVTMPGHQLIRQYKAIEGQLNHVLVGVKETTLQQPKAFYVVKLATIKDLWQQIESLHRGIYEATEVPENLGYTPSHFYNLQDEVLESEIRLSTLLEQYSPITPSPAFDEPTRNNNIKMKLPQIEIPKFDGNYLKWRQFRDLFREIIHKQNMPACEKLWYLRSNLSGEAETLVKHLPLLEENYVAAWELLQERYENPRLLVNALVSKLLAQPLIANESSAAIKSLHDITRECLKGLEGMNIPTATWDPLLLHILIRKLDKSTHSLYEQSLPQPRKLQAMDNFLAFLQTRFQSLEALGSKPKGGEERRSSTSRSLSVTANKSNCAACKGSHPLFSCKSFLNMIPKDRLKLVQGHRLCVNCLQSGHGSSSCSRTTCKTCNNKHNTLLHLSGNQQMSSSNSNHQRKVESNGACDSANTPMKDSKVEAITLSTRTSKTSSKYMMLSTVLVNVQGSDGTIINCRAILDSGSQINIVSERLRKKLQLPQQSTTVNIQGIGSGHNQTTARVNFLLKSRVTAYTTRVEAYVLSTIITPQPAREFDVSNWNIPQNIQLADPNFYRPDRVDLLLGVEFYYQLLSIGQIKLGDDLPILQNTILGWIVAGGINGTKNDELVCGIGTEDTLSKQVERFWALDNLPSNKPYLSPRDKQCEAHFARQTKRTPEGRFVVSLPFATNSSTLGESKSIALRRFHALETKLSRQPQLREEYVKFMDEYLALGHMQEATDVSPTNYFLPHHCVLRPESSTTKVRVVFDASAKTTSNVSLNDLLLTGPTLQDKLFSILLRFRLPRYVLTSDIEKMFRQILVKPEERNFQLILWRRSPEEPIKVYQLKTVTYGTRSAPYLATKCLQELAKKGISKYLYASKAILQNTYVDDIMTGCDSLPELLQTQSELVLMLGEAGFKLRKWCSNNQTLLNRIPSEDVQLCLDFNDSTDEFIKTLGIITWLPKTDTLKIKTSASDSTKITKRTISSDIFRIFDPLGLVAPVVSTAKIFLRKVWTLKLDWDAALPMELHTKWTLFREELKAIENINIPRHIYANNLPRAKQLHVFADASKQAYGAVAYIRSIADKVVIVRLLCAKSHVADERTFAYIDWNYVRPNLLLN